MAESFIDLILTATVSVGIYYLLTLAALVAKLRSELQAVKRHIIAKIGRFDEDHDQIDPD